MVILHFDASQVEPGSGPEPVPAGRYAAAIVASDMKATRTGTGRYLELEYQLLDGTHQGRRVWSRHTLHHPNTQTVEIARRELSAICHAVGVLRAEDSTELHQRPLTITVTVRTRPDTGEKVNEVIGWARKDATTGLPPQAGAPGGPAKPVWLQR